MRSGRVSLTGAQYRSHVSFSICKAARSATKGTRVSESSNDVSEPDELNRSHVMPGSVPFDEMERRF